MDHAVSLAAGRCNQLVVRQDWDAAAAKSAVQKQPKIEKLPPILDELKFQVTLAISNGQCPAVDSKGCLISALGPAPAGSRDPRVLRLIFEDGASSKPKRPKPVSGHTQHVPDANF